MTDFRLHSVLRPLTSVAMDGPGTLPRWSASALSTYERCGERYRRRYVERERGPGSVPMAVGTAVHRAAALDNGARLALDQRAKLGELVDVAVAAYDEALDRDRVEAPAPERGEGRDGAAAGARGWGAHVSPSLPRPLACEERIEADLAGVRLVGVLDYVTPGPAGDVVGDLKTGRAPAAGAAARSAQLTLYGILWRAKTGRWPAAVALDHLRPPSAKRRAATWQHERQASPRGPGDYAAVVARIGQVQAAVAAGVFLPAGEHEFTCAPRWCEFWPTCRYVAPARRALSAREE